MPQHLLLRGLKLGVKLKRNARSNVDGLFESFESVVLGPEGRDFGGVAPGVVQSGLSL